ncbi:MAG: 5,10-methylenetetrahydrofolate reductase [Desulfobacteraceae bacterium 4484_190.1]|nr:MAG: 5,10-methylenetetrahydrofolate reductase [Desulfobacteraceae bacterium 4484_190.1]
MSLEAKIKSGEFVVLGEFEPPKGADFSRLLKNARQIKGRVDAVMVPEMGNAVMKASSLGGCAFLQSHGIETVFQVCCRDRNRLALQADILAATALGIPNIMAVPGEDITYGDHPQARLVNDLNLIELLETMQKLQNGKDMAGVELSGVPNFCTGSSVNAGALGGVKDIEMQNLNKMTNLGVQFLITTPVFDLHRFQQFMKHVDTTKGAVIPTVLLLKSAGMARYIDRNIKSISIPKEIIRDIQKAPDKLKQCINLAAETIGHLKDMGMAGVMVSTVGWEDKLPQVLDAAKL